MPFSINDLYSTAVYGPYRGYKLKTTRPVLGSDGTPSNVNSEEKKIVSLKYQLFFLLHYSLLSLGNPPLTWVKTFQCSII